MEIMSALMGIAKKNNMPGKVKYRDVPSRPLANSQLDVIDAVVVTDAEEQLIARQQKAIDTKTIEDDVIHDKKLYAETRACIKSIQTLFRRINKVAGNKHRAHFDITWIKHHIENLKQFIQP
jgi:hypothetical protein